MIDFSTLQGLSVPEGVVTQISVNGKTVWQKAVTPTGIYDDEWPIEWNSLAVANNTTIVFESMTYVKISNLILTTDELATLQWACSVNGNDYASAFTGSQEYNGVRIGYCNFEIGETFASAQIYCVPDEIVGVDLDGITFPESGTYFYLEQGTEYPNEAFSFSLNLPVTATHYLYGREADSVVSYNGVTLPDIETAYVAVAEANGATVELLKEHCPYTVILTSGASTALYILGFELSIDANGKLNNSVGGLVFAGYSYGDSWGEFTGVNADAGSFATDPSNCIWSNHDILNSDGTTYLAASDPVKSYPDADVALRENEEFLYYEGVGLPYANLTEADLADYPYHLITHMNAYSYVDEMGQTISEPEQYRLTISSAPFYSDGTGNGFKVADDTAKYKCWFCYGDDFSEWVFGHENTNPYIVFYTFVWANHDVYNADNHDELYKSAGVEPFAVKRIGNLYGRYLLSHEYPTPGESGYEPLPEYAATDYSYHVLSVCYSSYLAFMEMRMFAKPVVVDGDFISTKNGESVEYLFYETNWSNPSKDYPYDWDFVCYENKSGDITPVNNVWDGNGSMVRWANFDIVDSEGAVCIAASDPIHVYVKE